MDFRKKTTPSPESDVTPGGLKAELTSFLRDASAYLRLRSELFAIEAKEAGQAYRKKMGLMAIGAALIILSYLLILVALIGIMAAAINPNVDLSLRNWIGGALILATGHFSIGFFLYRKGKNTGVDQELFEYTRNELQKEQEWLKHKRKP